MKKQVSVIALCAGLSAGVAAPAWAQDANGGPSTSGASASTVATAPQGDDSAANSSPDIVVTAQRRSERLIDVPISITAIGGDATRGLGAQSTRDLSQLVPGVILPSRGLALQPSVRGISSQGTSAGDEANVATYVDDFYIASSYEGPADLADVERIEVLKGPQGTLFGRNATGGAIKIITRQPQFAPEAHFTGSYGFDFKEIKLSGFVTGPLSRSVAASLAVNYGSDDGYVYNIQTGHRSASRDAISMRGRLLFNLAPNFKVIVTGNYSNGDDTAAFALVPFQGNNQNYSNPALPKPSEPTQIAGVDPVFHFNVYGGQVNADLDLGGVDIKSVTGYRSSSAVFGFDTDRTILPQTSGFAQVRPSEFSQEIDLATPAGNRLALTGGLYYFHSNTTYINYGFVGDYVFTLGVTPDPVGTQANSLYSNVVTDSGAAFGEATYKLTDKLKLIGGIRYTTEKKTFNYHDIFRPAGIRSIVDANHRWNSVTYRAVAQYEFSHNFNVYASFNTGFKSGVFASITYPLNEVNPEKINAYELGAKAKVGGFNISASVFHYDYKDIQIQARDIVNGILLVQLFNAADSVLDGADLSISGPISDNLSVNGGLSWLPTAKYLSFPNSQVTVPTANNIGNITVSPYDASGSRMFSAPKFTANLGAMLHQPLASGTLLVNGNVAYNGGFYFQIANLGHQKAYTVVNGSIGWRIPSGKFTMSVFAENLFNARYGFYRAFGTIGTSQAYARPRLIGIRLQTDFK